MTEKSNITDLLRMIGVMAVGVGAAWALQVLGFGGSTAAGMLLWILASASIAGAGAGLIYASMMLRKTDVADRNCLPNY